MTLPPSALEAHARSATPVLLALSLWAAGCGSDSGPPGNGVTDAGARGDAQVLDVAVLTDQQLPDDMALDAGPAADGGPPDGSVPTPCGAFANPSASGTVAFAALDECSGLAASRTQPGLLYAHNDSGDSARFFALDGYGALRGEFALAGATFRDVEDIALGPGPGGATFVFLADTGDNDARSGGPNPRADVSIYRVPEPLVPRFGAPANSSLSDWERLRFTYPGGPFDCESFFVDPRNGDFFFVTKVEGGVSPVFRAAAPHTAGTTSELVQVATIAFGTPAAPGNALATAADFDVDGRRILVRTYGSVLLYEVGVGESVGAALSRAATQVPAAGEAQGEAVAFVAGGYVTASEGASQTLWFQAESCD